MLLPDVLSESLLDRFMPSGGGFPSTPVESGQRFAGAVADWFTLAMAGPFPCATAKAREAQLAGQATAALMAALPPAAGAQLALAVASYMAGQVFGAGTASYPLAGSAVAIAFGAVFADLTMSDEDRAQRMAEGCLVLAVSTLVVFPPPLPTLPVL